MGHPCPFNHGFNGIATISMLKTQLAGGENEDSRFSSKLDTSQKSDIISEQVKINID